MIPGKEHKKEKFNLLAKLAEAASVPGMSVSAIGKVPQVGEANPVKPMTEPIDLENKPAAPEIKTNSSASTNAFRPSMNNPARGRRLPSPRPLRPQQVTHIPRPFSKIAYKRNTGLADSDGLPYTNTDDVILLSKLGYTIDKDYYLFLPRGEEREGLYSYIEKNAGIPKDVSRCIDEGTAFSAEYLKDMDYEVPKGYEIKGDLCCPVEKTAFELNESPEKTAILDPAIEETENAHHKHKKEKSILDLIKKHKFLAATGSLALGGLKAFGAHKLIDAGLSNIVRRSGIAENYYSNAAREGFNAGITKKDLLPRYRRAIGTISPTLTGLAEYEVARGLSRDLMKTKRFKDFKGSSVEDVIAHLKATKHLKEVDVDPIIQNLTEHFSTSAKSPLTKHLARGFADRDLKSNRLIKWFKSLGTGESVPEKGKGLLPNAGLPAAITAGLGYLTHGPGGAIGGLAASSLSDIGLARATSNDSVYRTINTLKKGITGEGILRGMDKAQDNSLNTKFKQLALGLFQPASGEIYEMGRDVGRNINTGLSLVPNIGNTVQAQIPQTSVMHSSAQQVMGTLGRATEKYRNKAINYVNNEMVTPARKYGLGEILLKKPEIKKPKAVPAALPLKEKTAAADPSQTILITGHSGSGKSTLGKLLAEKLNLPLQRVDAQESWDNLRADLEDRPDYERKALTPGSIENKKYIRDIRKIVGKSLKEINGPAILEGTQVTTLPNKQLQRYLANIVVGGNVEQSIAQRLQRTIDKAAKKGIVFSPEELEKKKSESRLVANSWQPGIDKFNKLPGVLRYNHIEHQAEPLIAQLQQLMSKKAEVTHKLKSSNIKAVGYNKEDKSMDIAFHSGGNYTYKDVPKSLFERIKRVKSPGKFFHKHIKKDNNFEYNRLEKKSAKIDKILKSLPAGKKLSNTFADQVRKVHGIHPGLFYREITPDKAVKQLREIRKFIPTKESLIPYGSEDYKNAWRDIKNNNLVHLEHGTDRQAAENIIKHGPAGLPVGDPDLTPAMRDLRRGYRRERPRDIPAGVEHRFDKNVLYANPQGTRRTLDYARGSNGANGLYPSALRFSLPASMVHNEAFTEYRIGRELFNRFARNKRIEPISEALMVPKIPQVAGNPSIKAGNYIDKLEKEAGKVIMRLTSDTPLLKAVTEGLKGKKIDFSRELPYTQPVESTELYKLLERQSKIEPLYGANQIERFAPIKNEESKRFNLIGMIKNLLKPAMGVQKEAAYRNIPQHIRDLMIRRSQGDKSALEALQSIGRANAAKRTRLKPIKDLINRTSEPVVKPSPVTPPTTVEQPVQLDPAEIKARFDEIRRMIGNSGQVQ